MPVKIITDSTSDLPADLVESLDIAVVPLNIHFGTETFKDGIDLLPDDFYGRLIDGPVLPKTSQPSVGHFAEVYDRLGRDADGIVSVHVSSMLSGTFNSAVQGASQASVSCPIEVVDTLRVSMSAGIVAMMAARAAQSGAGMEEVVGVARDAVERCRCIAMLDTLEYLEKGGRIGKAKALVGSLLKIRPMIRIEGEVHELGKERSRKRGIARLEQIARETGPLEELSVIYSTDPDDACALADNLGDLLPEGKEPIIARFGPVIGTYAGPGALGIGLLRAKGS
jgi:DegV family protein with EDD domain